MQGQIVENVAVLTVMH